MNPNEKGWLKEYVTFRLETLHQLNGDLAKRRSHPEHSLYRILQPTGLMYGQSTGVSSHPDHDAWHHRDKMKVLLAESLINSSLLAQELQEGDPPHIFDILD